MRTLLFALVLGVAPFAAHVAGPRCDIHHSHNATGVMAAENDWVAALEKRDDNRLACLLAPGFMDMAWDKQLHSRADVLKWLPSRPNNGIHLSAMKIELSGNKAVARGINTATKPDGKPMGKVKFEDMFEYRGGYWRALTAQETPIR